MPAAILGDRASGKTTFLGLLYAAQVKYGTGRQDTFRFSATPQALKFMAAVYQNMKDGMFPSATLKDEMSLVEFIFGYRKMIAGRLPTWIKEQRWMNPFATLDFGAYDVSGEDVQEFIETGVAASPVIQQLLRAFVVVILVDCSKMTTDVDSQLYKRMLKYDGDVATLCVAFQKYKKDENDRMKAQGMNPGLPIIYPAIVLSKFDTLRDEVLAKLGLTRGITARWFWNVGRPISSGGPFPSLDRSTSSPEEAGWTILEFTPPSDWTASPRIGVYRPRSAESKSAILRPAEYALIP